MRSVPKVTILTPTFNRPFCLAEAIGSVLAQTFRDWEMLVINDGGGDVREVVEAFRDERLVYINRPENRGKAACLNLGLRRARGEGEYIAYLDDDDIWYPCHLDTFARALDSNPDAGVAYSDLYAVAVVKGKGGKRYPLEKRILVCRDYNRMLMFHFNHTLHVSLMHRKALVFRAGLYNESVRVLIDWDLTRKLSFFTDFVHVPTATGEYFQPIEGSDRISDVQRKEGESYQQNLRRVRADLPPEPWPKVRKVAVVFPIAAWDDRDRDVVRYLTDRLDYPCRIILPNLDARRSIADCRQVLGPLAELRNVQVCAVGEGTSLREAYVKTALGADADYCYLPSRDASPDVQLRLIRAVSYLEETEAEAVRWEPDPAGPYDVIAGREWLRAASGGQWCDVSTMPRDWMPEELATDCLLHFSQQCETEGDYRAAQRFLDDISAMKRGSTGGAYLVQHYAKVAFALGDYERAEKLCDELLSAGYSADNWVRLGQIRHRRKEYQRAAEAYRRGIEAIGLREADLEDPAFPLAGVAEFDAFRAVAGLGECMLELGRPAEAARLMRQAARLKANSCRPHVVFGQLFLHAGQLDRAREAFELALRYDCGGKGFAVTDLLADVCERQGDLDRAYGLCRAALSRAPDNGRLLARMRGLACRLGKEGELAGAYEKCLSVRPGHVPALLGLAEIKERLGLHAEALDLAERAALLAREDARVQGTLARLRAAARPGQEVLPA